MSDLTLITPAAPHHVPMLRRCIDSVKAQTVTVEHLIEVDEERLGPGVIRNRLLRQVVTPFVSFLDADDMLEPDFAEKTLAAVGNKYIYTDWIQDGEVVQAPDCAWIDKTFHLVTAVMPTAWALAVDGFDETLTGMEDTDFFLKLIARRFCGKRLPIPLVHYSANGGRARTIHETGTVRELAAEMQRRYGEMKVGCCGHDEAVTAKPSGERLPGDVLAQALWHGNRSERGLVSGRHYPRTAYPKTCYVDPRDVDYSPRLWRRLEETPQVVAVEKPAQKPQVRGLDALEQRFIPKPIKEVPVLEPDVAKKKVVRKQWKPDFEKVRKLAGKKPSSAVWFVASEKEWPSYSDFWKLVSLSGYQVASMTFAAQNLNNRDYTFIFVTPEGIPDCSQAKARCIFWQFEYAGAYTTQKNRATCAEQWSSDPYDAQQTGARYVLLGSHPGLKTAGNNEVSNLKWDIVTLSYLTPRRRAVYHLINRQFAPDYPGHDGKQRDEQLRYSRIMLHVNQHDEPALAPIKLALAAAYRIPVIAEAVIDPGPYSDAVLFSSYQNIAAVVERYFAGDVDVHRLQTVLYQLLCVEYPFSRCVEDALARREARAAA